MNSSYLSRKRFVGEKKSINHICLLQYTCNSIVSTFSKFRKGKKISEDNFSEITNLIFNYIRYKINQYWLSQLHLHFSRGN